MTRTFDLTSSWDDELFDAWLRGELTELEDALMEVVLEADPRAAEAFARWQDAAEARADDALRRLDVDDIADRARVAALDALDVAEAVPALAGRRRWRPAALAAACLALVALGAVGALVAAPQVQTWRIARDVCESWRKNPPLALAPALDCAEPTDALLGSASQAIAGPRAALDARSRPDDADWLAARTAVALLERNPEDALRLLRDRDDLMDENPRLRSDLAAALLLGGDMDGARRELERAARLAPDDPLIEGNLRMLE